MECYLEIRIGTYSIPQVRNCQLIGNDDFNRRPDEIGNSSSQLMKFKARSWKLKVILWVNAKSGSGSRKLQNEKSTQKLEVRVVLVFQKIVPRSEYLRVTIIFAQCTRILRVEYTIAVLSPYQDPSENRRVWLRQSAIIFLK